MASSPIDAAVALTRLGLGARPGEIARVAADPRGWAMAQIRRQGAPRPPGDLPDTTERLGQYFDYQSAARAPAPGAGAVDPAAEARREARQAARRDIVQDTAQAFLSRAQLGAATEDGFAERWALFWSNALTVSAAKFDSGAFIAQYECDAVRPHVFGRFEDLVMACEQHPAMLLYLDQARSTGPDSPVGARRRAGLNENLAREMMELHTVGADAGYTQADVTELARALTGWSIPTAREAESAGADAARPRRARMAAQVQPGPNGFVFRANVHEPGARTVMGKTYPPGGLDQGQAVLRDLARHPATARRLSRRLAAHFVADSPPDALVARLEAAWTRSGGDLAQVARALIAAPETWTPRPAKIKTPYDLIVSTHRALGTRPQRLPPLRQALADMGQPLYAPPSPEGWPDTAADWAGPDALVKRLNWAAAAAATVQVSDTDAVAADALGARLGERTRLAVARAESRPEALTLLFMSPEFQRR
ncbi:hypothetical protein SH203_01752 [Brevundimonas sp. SH203]|uniref:DUF1800 domain-containing protein n=1 Tax=Brevundimonas sp. SH203 TaxID=345167 RepID=UPI0009D2970C|nr:DUF1800 domain-containing protein [Brevundimonas sp. SH203]GAW41348.1 hypothetical protein SH203_01752 [Brevundimonas sp. SH203]